MFIGLWNFADDYGVLDNSNRRILGNIYPYDMEVTEKDIQKWKDELVTNGLLVKIEYLNHSYLFIKSWAEHQKVDHKGKETIPIQVIIDTLARLSRETSESLDRKIKIKIKIKNTSNEVSGETPDLQKEEFNSNSGVVVKENFGREDINKMLIALKSKIGIQNFVDSAIERNMAKHCVNLIGKIGKDAFVMRLDALLADPFHYKNCNKIKYIYNNIKGFIEPKSKVLDLNNISK